MAPEDTPHQDNGSGLKGKLRRAGQGFYRCCLAWFVKRYGPLFIITYRSITKVNFPLRAAALTYYSVLSVVPLLAVVFSIFKGLGGLEAAEGPLKRFILNNLAVGKAEEVTTYLEQYVANISAGAIAGVGILFLLYSIAGLLISMEQTINEILGVKKGRSLLLRLAIYWCMVTLMPVFLGISLSITASLQESVKDFFLFRFLPMGVGAEAISVAIITVGFTLIYLIIPHIRIGLLTALKGGFAAGVVWTLVKYAFVAYSAKAFTYNAIYGALGVLPIFMLWIYISWAILLAGAGFTFAFQNTAAKLADIRQGRTSQAVREQLALILVGLITRSFLEGNRPPTAEALSGCTQAPPQLVLDLLQAMVDHGFLTEVVHKEAANGDMAYVPSRDPHGITAAQIVATLREEVGRGWTPPAGAVPPTTQDLMDHVRQATTQVLEAASLTDLARSLDPCEGQDALDNH